MKKTPTLLCLLCLVCLLAGAALAQDTPTLRYGSTGEAVRALQERLMDLGYYTFRVTGNFQENSQKAVRLFQREHGLPETGEADAALQAMIHGEAAMPRPTPTPVPLPAMDVPYSAKVEYGSKGEDVRRVQARLMLLGYYGMELSGEFWTNTRDAVKAFQLQNALKVDGVVGRDTWDALFFGTDIVPPDATPRPTPSPTPVPYRIGVDVTNQVTTVYTLDEQGGYSTVLKHMLCSTGTEKDPTPPGTYTLNGQTSRWCYFPKWGTHGQYWTRIDAYNAFHSVIYSEANPMALKTSSYTGLGKRASHGCIRLMIEDAKWIYSNCGKGTEVIVYEGALDEELTKSLKIPPLDRSVMLPEPTPQPTRQPAYSAAMPPPEPGITLERGVENEAVYWLQCRLAELGYYHGSITGGYYQGTADAVKAYQRDRGLTADGKAGRQTMALLYAEAAATPAPTATPLPEPTFRPSPRPRVTQAPTPVPTEPPPFALFVPAE